jgi:hypothetical protein
MDSVSGGSFGCIDEIDVPLYDSVMWVARMSGELHAAVAVGPDGAAKSIILQGNAQPVLKQMVRDGLQAAKFSSRCANQTTQFIFLYRFEGRPSVTPHNRIKFRSPNRFEIVANPPLPIPPQP